MKKVSIIKNGQVAYACEGTQEQIDRWFNKHSKKFGSPGEYEIVEEDLEQHMINAEAQAYLDETDWMIIRQMENPSKPIPEEILIKRQLCRDSIKR